MDNDQDQIRESLQSLKEDLGNSLRYAPDETMEDILEAQAAALDAAFRLLFAEAPERYEKLPHFITALKMQAQYRQTALAINTLKNKETGKNQNKKCVKRTEQDEQ